MNPEAHATTLKAMKLHGMADAVNELAAQASPAYQQAAPVLEMLLKAEASERELRSINYQMKVARFPAYRDLTGFDFSQSPVDEALVQVTPSLPVSGGCTEHRTRRWPRHWQNPSGHGHRCTGHPASSAACAIPSND
jgi:hypothetical protein